MFWVHVCLCTLCVPNAQGDQKRELGPLELKLWMVVNWVLGIEPVGAGDWTWVLEEESVLLTTEPSLQPLYGTSFCSSKKWKQPVDWWVDLKQNQKMTVCSRTWLGHWKKWISDTCYVMTRLWTLSEAGCKGLHISFVWNSRWGRSIEDKMVMVSCV